MMTILARLLPAVMGSKLLPAGLLVTVLTLGHQWWLERDARMQAQSAATAKQRCEAEQQLVMTTAQLAAARAERDRALEVSRKKDEAIQFEQQVTDEVRAERKAIKEEFDAYKMASSADPRCLSDGVLKLLGGSGSMGESSAKR